MMIARLSSVPVLILDGLERMGTSWGEDRVFQILDYRYLHQLPTMIVSTPPGHQTRFNTRLFDETICRPVAIISESYLKWGKKGTMI